MRKADGSQWGDCQLTGLAEKEMNRREHSDSTQFYDNQAQEHLDRYFTSLALARQELLGMFDENDFWLMVDAMNGALIRAAEGQIRYLLMTIEDSMRIDDLDTKWKVDRAKLLEKLAKLTFFQCVALIDAIEIWWGRQGVDDHLKIGDLLTDN